MIPMSLNVWACLIIAAIHSTAEGLNHRISFFIWSLAAVLFFLSERKKWPK